MASGSNQTSSDRTLSFSYLCSYTDYAVVLRRCINYCGYGIMNGE